MRTIDQLLGTFDPVWDECQPRSVRLDQRNGNDIFLVAHHSVSTTLQSIEATFKSPNRSVSAQAGVGPLVSGRDDYRSKQFVPWRTHRAYTTASPIDDKAITFEMADLRLEYPWPIGVTGLNWFAELAAAMHVELGMPLDTYHILDHATVYGRGWGSYATQCAGDFMRARINDHVIPLARQIVAGGNKPAPTPTPEDDMSVEDLFTNFTKAENVAAGETIYLHINKDNFISVAVGPAKHVVGNLQVQVSDRGVSGGKPYKASLKVTPVINTIDSKGNIAKTVSLGAREIVFTSGDTFGEVTVDAGLAANQKIAFRIGDSETPFRIQSAVFRGMKVK